MFINSTSELEDIVNDIEYEHVFSMEFQCAGEHDGYLLQLSKYVNQGLTSGEGDKLVDPWYKSREKLQAVNTKLKQFSNFAKANCNNVKVAFVVTSQLIDDDNIISNNAAELVQYNEGMSTTRTFKPPPAPGKPVAKNVTDTTIILSWSTETDESIQGFTIAYKQETTPNNKWDEVKTSGGTEVTISSLAPNTKYIFKVFSLFEYGISEESKVSSAILTNKVVKICGKPGTPRVMHTMSNSVKLAWEKPNENANQIIDYYATFCKNEDSSCEWKKRKIADASVTEAIVDHLAPNCYIFKIFAHCVSGNSEESDPVTVILREEICSPPGKPTAHSITQQSISLIWSKPTKNHHYYCHKIYNLLPQKW